MLEIGNKVLWVVANTDMAKAESEAAITAGITAAYRVEERHGHSRKP